jgi:hypothetical protein
LLTKIERVLSINLPHIDQGFPGFGIGDFAVIYGHSPSIKALTLLLSVRCQLPIDEGGLNSTAIFLDGGNTFDPYAISAIAQQYGLDPHATLERVFVSRAFTAYQLSALVLETLENALKQYRSKLVLISDVTTLFLDRDVPTKEAMGVFNKAMIRLSNLVARRNVIVITSCLPHQRNLRCVFLESVLFGKTNTAIKIEEVKGTMRFSLENHPFLKPFKADLTPNAVALERFTET